MAYSDKGICSGDDIYGEKCYGYNTYESHSNIVAGAGGRSYSFDDPRPGKDGERLYPKRYFINNEQTKIKGVNLYDRQGNFACSYIGESFDDLVNQNREDIKFNHSMQCRETNLQYGTKRDAIYPRIGDRDLKVRYDTKKMETALPYKVKDVELKTREDNPELYDKYDGINNPNNGHQMSCTAVYTNKINERCPTEEVQYVELRDKKTGESYHYISSYDKNVDEQIAEDCRVEIQKKEPEQTTVNENKINQGVKRN